ncbi:anion transporter [Natronorubrum sediminis]|uniref:Anion transporter n=1 Tax=Natronorubrum sediminis TaxID=640943 RepID=A0A1H6FTI5_9EURY|nr:SLC13 family permease [Natronorubrum sediminis]SEH13580.1 anion transporter [Natronorubrum sediminis]
MNRSVALRSVDRIQFAGLVVSALVLLIGTVIETPQTIGYRTQLLFTILAATIVLWVTKPIPYSISSLLCVVLLYGFGVTETFEAAVVGFASSLVFFLILLLLIGKSIVRVDLDEWISDRLVTETSTIRGSLYRLTGTILLLAFVMPSGTARTVTFMPIIDQINEQYGLGPDSAFRSASYYIIGHVNHIGSTALMTGGGMAIVTAELINSMVRELTWVEWALFMIPPAASLFVLASLCGIWVYRVPTDAVSSEHVADPDPEPVDRSSSESLDREQKLVFGTLLLAIAMWILGSFLGIDAIIPAMIVVLIFYLPGIRVLSPADFREISWGIVFLVGAMLSILEVMEELEAIDLVVDVLFSFVSIHSAPVLVMSVLFVFAVAVRAIFSSVAAAIAILLPILLEFAATLGVNALYSSFSLMLVLVSTSLFPFNISTVLLAYERGPLSIKDVFFLGLMTVCFSAIVVLGSWLFYWPVVEALVDSLQF